MVSFDCPQTANHRREHDGQTYHNICPLSSHIHSIINPPEG